MAHVSAITIEEIELEGAAKPRRVVLRGGGLPKQGEFPIAGKLRVKTRFPVGNPEGTQHVLGPIETPGTLSGEWHHGMLIASPCTIEDSDGARTVTQPTRLMTMLEAMFRGGARLRVTWSTRIHVPVQEDVKYVREGRAVSWDFRPETMDDVRWSIDFEWTARGDAPPLPTLNDDFFVNAEEMLARADAALDAAVLRLAPRVPQNTPGAPKLSALTTASMWATRVTANMRRFQNVARKLNDTTQRVLALRSQVVNIGATGTAITADYVGLCTRTNYEFQRTPPELGVTRRRAGDIARSSRALYEQESNLTAVTTSALRTAKAGMAPVNQVRTNVAATNSAAKRFYKTMAGDSPTSVSAKLYGTPDRSVDILRVNRLSLLLTEFNPGTILILPVT